MTGHKARLIKFDDTRSKIKLTDSRSLQEEGERNMVIKRSIDRSTIIEDVCMCHSAMYEMQLVKCYV
jgi:hypothetical protein